MAMILDINTPMGQKTLEEERKAVELFHSRHPDFAYIHTPKEKPAKLDAVLLRNGTELFGTVLMSCRRNCTIETFETTWERKWLITRRKLYMAAWISKHNAIPLYAFVYIVGEDALIIKRLYEPEKGFIVPIESRYSLTQKTVNGGLVYRWNAYIDLTGMSVLRREL